MASVSRINTNEIPSLRSLQVSEKMHAFSKIADDDKNISMAAADDNDVHNTTEDKQDFVAIAVDNGDVSSLED